MAKSAKSTLQSGPSADGFWITTAMCETSITANQPRGTTLPASPKLPVVVRAIESMASVTVTIQSLGGATHTRTMAAGDVYDRMAIVAITGLSGNTDLLGYA